MDKTEFKALAEIYGSNLSKWPESKVTAAREYKKLNDDVNAILEEEAHLDELLLNTESAIDTEQLSKTIVNAAVMHPQDIKEANKSFVFWLSSILKIDLKPSYIWAPSGGLLAMAVLGFFIGITGTLPGMEQNGMLLDPVFYTEGQDIDVLYQWADSEGLL